MWLKFCGKEKSTYEKAIESLKEQRQYKQFVDDYLQVAQVPCPFSFMKNIFASLSYHIVCVPSR